MTFCLTDTGLVLEDTFFGGDDDLAPVGLVGLGLVGEVDFAGRTLSLLPDDELPLYSILNLRCEVRGMMGRLRLLFSNTSRTISVKEESKLFQFDNDKRTGMTMGDKYAFSTSAI